MVGRYFVMSANQCVTRDDLPSWIKDVGPKSDGSLGPDFVSRGGLCMVGPTGDVLTGPMWEVREGMSSFLVDSDDCIRGRLDLDVGGSYSRYVIFLPPNKSILLGIRVERPS